MLSGKICRKENMSIRVFIQTDKFKGGVDIFRSRLIGALNKLEDIEVVTNFDKKFDVELAFIRRIYKHNKPIVLRLSNCYYFKGYKPWNNKPIAKAITKSSHIVFQSKFAYKLLDRVLRIGHLGLMDHCDHSIIYNGVDLDYINEIEPNDKIIPGSFITCARWDPNKRPLSTIKGFLKANTKRHLYVIGDKGVEGVGKKLGQKYKDNKYIHFLGSLSNREVISAMKSCEYQIHLSFIDICPNIVLEGLSCGLKVLCTNLGGTPELVGNRGVVLNTDKFWPHPKRYLKKRIEDLDNLKSRTVADGIEKLMKHKNVSSDTNFDINEVAKRYERVIKKVLK